MNPSRSPWIVRAPVPQAHRLRLFCFPYAGGGASVYRIWSQHLGRYGVEVCGVQLPGRENRLAEPPLDSVPALVHTMATALADWFHQPFCFFGHSFGALVCFELTRELRRRGEPMPGHLFVSGARPPQVKRMEPEIHRLPDGEFIDALARRYKGIPREVLAERELMELLLPTLRADLSAFETYRYVEQAPIDIPITALGGTDDPCVGHFHLQEWRCHTTRDFAFRLIAGDHFFLNGATADVIATIARELRLTG